MNNDHQKPVQGWKAASIMLGVTGFLLLATWVMLDREKGSTVTTAQNAERTVGMTR